MANGEPVTLVATGPLTNIALLLRAHPEVAAGIDRLVFMGGSASVGQRHGGRRVQRLPRPGGGGHHPGRRRDLDIPVTMYGLDVFEQVLVDRDDAARLRARLDPACQLAGALIASQCDKVGIDAVTIGDAGTVCAVVDPDGPRHRTTRRPGGNRARLHPRPDHRRPAGMPIDHVRMPHSMRRPWVDVALAVDARGYAALWLDTLLS